MGTTDTQRQTIAQQINSNPALAQAIRDDAAKPFVPGVSGPAARGGTRAPKPGEVYSKGYRKILAEHGITLDHDDQVGYDNHTGAILINRANWFQRNADWAIPLMIAGGGAAAVGATAGAGAGAAAGGAAGGSAAGAGGASTATIAGAGTGIGGGTAATTAAAASPSLLHSLLPTIIGAGTSVAGGLIQAHSASEATKAQTEAADKAIALQKERYALQRQDTAPYRALGQGAVGNLGYLSGIDTQSAVPALSATVPTQPYGTLPQATTPAAGPQTPPAAPQAQMVQIKSPQGKVGMVPADRVNDALAAGGVRV